jgi:hypothetical protein
VGACPTTRSRDPAIPVARCVVREEEIDVADRLPVGVDDLVPDKRGQLFLRVRLEHGYRLLAETMARSSGAETSGAYP